MNDNNNVTPITAAGTAERIEEQRTRILDAMGIIGAAKGSLEHGGSPIDGKIDQNTAVDAWTALRAAYAILDSVGWRLNEIAESEPESDELKENLPG